ncbi:MAG: ParA family protein [Nostoc sp.]
MKTIAIASLKGVQGKTTLAVNLGVAAFLNKKQVALIDLAKFHSPTTLKSLVLDMGSFFLDFTKEGVSGLFDVDFGGRHRSQYFGWDG